MTLQNLRSSVAIPSTPVVVSTTPSSTSITIDAANEIAAFIVRAPKAGNIRSVSWNCVGVGTGGDITVGLYQVDASTGFPADTPTPLAANTFATKTLATTDSNDHVGSGNFTADATVTRGQLFAVCFINPGASFGNIQIAAFADQIPGQFPYSALFTGTWAKVTNAPNIVLHYDDGTAEIPAGCFGLGTADGNGLGGISSAISTSTTPDVWGARIVPPFKMRVTGAWVWGDFDGDCNIKLVTAAWDGASSGLLASSAMDADVRTAATAGIAFVAFDTAVELDVGSAYRLIVEPTSTTNSTMYSIGCLTQAQFQAQCFAGAFALTTAKDPNDDTDWTNYNNGTDGYRFPWCGFLVDQLDDGAGGGSATGFPSSSMMGGVIQR